MRMQGLTDRFLDPAVWCPWGYAIASVDARGSGHSDGRCGFIDGVHLPKLTVIYRGSQATSNSSEPKMPKMGMTWSNFWPNSPSATETSVSRAILLLQSASTLSRLNNLLRSRQSHHGRVSETCTENSSTEEACELYDTGRDPCSQLIYSSC